MEIKMKKILYSGRSQDGRQRTGFVDAVSNNEAIAVLKKKGVVDITLHDDAFTALRRDDLENLSEKQIEMIANFEIKSRYNPDSMKMFLEVVWGKSFWILLWAGYLVWMWYEESYILLTFGLALALVAPILFVLTGRHGKNYKKLQIACVFGQWEQALGLINKLRRHLKQPDMAFDLDIRQACIIAKKCTLNEALAFIEYWKNPMNEIFPGIFEARVAEIYYAGGEYGEFLNKMRAANAASPQSPTTRLDLALAEARFGNTKRTDELLKKLRIEEVPPIGLPYIDWAKGVAAKRNKNMKAATYLNSAISQMMQFNENPATWAALALCVGDLAAASNDCGNKEMAKDLVCKVWDILKVHCDSNLLMELEDIIPRDNGVA